MWPLLFKVLNLPPHLASQTNLLLLGGIIHGPTAPSNIQPYLLVSKFVLTHSQSLSMSRTSCLPSFLSTPLCSSHTCAFLFFVVQVLVDELLLHRDGVETQNPLNSELRARIWYLPRPNTALDICMLKLCIVRPLTSSSCLLASLRLGLLGGDFPATCKLLNVQGTAAVWACPACYEQGNYSPGLKRMVYGRYRVCAGQRDKNG